MAPGKSELTRAARCAGWPKGSYDADKDTPETIAWIRVYKLVGQKKGCWG